MSADGRVQESERQVPCYWCGFETHPWPSSGAHKHEWRWCWRCEMALDQNGQRFEDEDD